MRHVASDGTAASEARRDEAPRASSLNGLIVSGPMPLAQLARRARNAKTGTAMLQTATHYLGEATAALAAAYWCGRARRQPISAALRGQLEGLVVRGSSFGAWVGVLREAAASVGGEALASLRRPLADRRHLDDFVRAIEADAESLGDGAEAAIAQLRAARKSGVLGLLDALVTFRNRFYGHGTMLPEAVCLRLAGPALRLVGQAASEPALFDGAWLGRTGIDLLHGGARYWKRLHGTSELIVEHVAVDPIAVSPSELCFVRGDEAVMASFLVCQEEDDTGLSRFGFFQRVRGKKAPFTLEYLDYLGGAFRAQGDSPLLSDLRNAETAVDDALPPADERRFGDFVLVGELGRGAMGVVHLATQPSLGRQVALKVLPPALTQDPVALGRFRREVQALGRCDHPNVVRVIASGVDDDRPWYAMELVRGADLAAVLQTLTRWKATSPALEAGHLVASASQRRARTDAKDLDDASANADTDADGDVEADAEADAAGRAPDLPADGALYTKLAALFAGAADGVATIHDHGMIHRDIKPANLMLTSDGERLVVMDLGLAAGMDASAALTRQEGATFVGSARYAAPEQLQAQLMKVDHRADVYGLGATLYELATQHPLYPASDLPELLRAKLQDEPTAPRDLDRRLPSDLETIIRTAMARRPEERYPTAADLAADLRAFADGRPIRARAPSPFDYLRLFYRRERRLVRLGAVAAATLVAVAAASFVVVEGERSVAVAERARAERLAGYVADDLFEELEPLGQLELLSEVADNLVHHYDARTHHDNESRLAHSRALVTRGGVRLPQGKKAVVIADLERAEEVLAGLSSPTTREAAERDLVLGTALRTRGELARKHGAEDEAFAFLERARELLMPLADRRARTELARVHNEMGLVLEQRDDYPAAEKAYQRSIELGEALSRDDPSRWRRRLAAFHNNVGGALERQNQIDRAIESFRLAERIAAEAVEERPIDLSLRHTLGTIRSNIARVSLGRGDIPGAIAAYRTSLATARELHLADPTNLDWAWAMASRCQRLAALLILRGDYAEAVALAQEGRDVQSQRVAVLGDHAPARRALAGLHTVAGEALLHLARHDEAEAELGRALALIEALMASGATGRDRLEHGLARARLAEVDSRRGELTRALARIDTASAELAKLRDAGDSPDLRHAMARVARIRGRVLEQRGERDRAKSQLEEALGLLSDVSTSDHALLALVAETSIALARLAPENAETHRARAAEILADQERLGVLAAHQAHLLATVRPSTDDATAVPASAPPRAP